MWLTGSQAITPYRKSDWDIICAEKDLNGIGLSFNGSNFIKHGSIEFINILELNNEALIEYYKYVCSTDYFYIDGAIYCLNVLPLDALYIQKRSHIWQSRNFTKNIFQLKEITDKMNTLPSLSNCLLKKRIKLTKEKYGDRVPTLNKTNEDFFDDTITKYFNHDDLHKTMAHYSEPLYEQLKKDKTLAKCEKDLWTNLSHHDKIRCVQEECYVIALERFVIPNVIKKLNFPPPQITFMKALEKVCTNLCSGWFRDFAIDNFWNIKQTYNPEFYNIFFKDLHNGILQRIK